MPAVMGFFGRYPYLVALAILSLAVATAETLWPHRATQRQLRPRLFSDVLHLVFNGHFLGVILYWIATRGLLPLADRALGRLGWQPHDHLGVAAHWPLWLQIPIVLVVADFLEWNVHRLLHRVPFLWELHKIHHSVGDGEMDWIVSFRFHWGEAVVYKSLLYLPLAIFGFAPLAMLAHAVVGTLVGHLNHANLNLGHGRWRYVVNSARMHLWHHARTGDGMRVVNFAIIFSAWDWLWGTASLPEPAPPRLGFEGDALVPPQFFGHAIWPLQRLWRRRSAVH